MKKIKILFAAAIFCAAAFVGYTSYQQATMTDEERLIQANLEALSEPGETYGPCSGNGYKIWNDDKGFLQKEKVFVDCWCNKQKGYRPKECDTF